VDAIAALPRYNFGGATGDLPLRNYTQQDFDNDVPVDDIHLVIVNAIIVNDSTVDSAAGRNLRSQLLPAGQRYVVRFLSRLGARPRRL